MTLERGNLGNSASRYEIKLLGFDWPCARANPAEDGKYSNNLINLIRKHDRTIMLPSGNLLEGDQINQRVRHPSDQSHVICSKSFDARQLAFAFRGQLCLQS